MNKYLESLIIFISLLIIIFIIDYFFINKRKLKGKKKKSIGEIDYLKAKFKLDPKKLQNKQVIFWISLINSFIISFTSCLILMISLPLIWQLLIAFVILFSLIYALYEIYGRYLKNKERK